MRPRAPEATDPGSRTARAPFAPDCPELLRRLHAALLAVAVAGSAQQAAGQTRLEYQDHPVRWYGSPVILYVYSPPTESGLTHVQLWEAARQAAREWDVACSALKLEVRLAAGKGRVNKDGRNSIVARGRRWCPEQADHRSKCYDARLSAITHVHKAPPGVGETEARIVEADIEVNGVDYAWGPTLGSPAADKKPRRPLAVTLMHEFGHVLGLAHSCRATGLFANSNLPRCSSAAPFLMVPDWDLPNAYVAKHPTERERRALCAIYPARSDRNQEGLGWILAVSILAVAVASVAAWLTRASAPRRDRTGGGDP